jgi:predicted N-acyltransferase
MTVPNSSVRLQYTVRVVDALADVPREEWQRLAGTNPFVNYDFLGLLESTGCVSPETGWTPQHLLVQRDGRLVGAAPAYLKTHSRGEFVFDQGWAQAFTRHGLAYYPKLIIAVPFTPVMGPRLLAENEDVRAVLAAAAVGLARELEVSSMHVLFPDERDRIALEQAGLLVRQQVQFHWSNEGYEDFDDFLMALSHDKRKKLKQDRKRVASAGITYRWLRGFDLTDKDLAFFYRCYVHTYSEHWSVPYLTLEFFCELHARNPNALLLVLAERGDVPVACALNVIGDRVLFGRYWGTMEFVSGLHFETCYTQGIDFCIANGLITFEGGAQGEHKLARGFEPTRTYSAHWISDMRFSAAIDEFLEQEANAVKTYVEGLASSAPFKASDSDR